MKYIKEWVDDDIKKESLDELFRKWLSNKLTIKIGDFLGSGVEGEVYEIDKHRVIKLTYPNVTISQHLSSKNLPGIAKIYQTGTIIAPRKFKADYNRDNYPEYDGIDLLNPERTHGPNDFEIGYIIMERLKIDKELTDDIHCLDEYLWFRFKDNHKHSDKVLEIIERADRRFGVIFLKTLFDEINNNQELIDEYKEFIKVVEPFQTRVKYYGNEMYSFDDSKRDRMIEIIDRMVIISNSLNSIGVDWGDIHHEQFGYNTSGEICAYDISMDFNSLETEFYKSLTKKKTKNIIREFKSFPSSRP